MSCLGQHAPCCTSWSVLNQSTVSTLPVLVLLVCKEGHSMDMAIEYGALMQVLPLWWRWAPAASL